MTHTFRSASSLLSKILPHEWLGVFYVVTGVVLLENLPVTYPRSALFLAYLVPVGLIGAVAAAALLFRRKKLPANTADLAAWVARSLLLLALVMPVHFLLKSFIFLINSNVWDVELRELDRLILFGRSPSIFFTQLFQSPWFLWLIDLVYSRLYYILLIIQVGLLMLLPRRKQRIIFVASYSSIWISGSLLYLTFPSWGPVFVQPEIFEQCLASMPGTVSVQSVLYQEISSLVQNPLGTRVIRFGCVAAFPSLHLSIVTLLALGSRSISSIWFRFNLLIVSIMLLGSVITGYHYLIDGIAGIILASALWLGWSRVYQNLGSDHSTSSDIDRQSAAPLSRASSES